MTNWNWKDLKIVDPEICTGSMMCPLHEHQTALVMQEVREAVELLDDAMAERNRYREQARHWKNVAALALVSLAGLFAFMVSLGVRKVL